MLFLVTVALTDMIGTNLFKHQFMRLRPCGDISFVSHVRLLVNHCGGYSFVSNHAANHFGMAAFFYFTMRPVIGRWAMIAFAWAALIAFAQVYVGLHYPADVLAGALLGGLTGGVTAKLFNKRFGFTIFDEPTISS
jgi:undecaprenyl-diphosphatase